MADYKLTLKKREETGKKSKYLREAGMIPSVVYGGKEPILMASEYVETEKVLRGAGYHSPIDLDIEGKKQMAIVKDVHIDPVTRRINNIEFKAISARAMVTATTPIVVVNFEESEASKTYHFAITQNVDEIDVKAKPSDLPKGLEVDASKMESLEDKLTIANIVLPEGVEFADKEIDMERVIVSLYDPVAEAEARAAEEAKAAAEAEEAAEGEGEGEGEASSEAEGEKAEEPQESSEEKTAE